MNKLKNFYRNITNLSGLEIMDFIVNVTNKDLTMLVQLNSEFNELYLKELEQRNKYYKSPEYKPTDPMFENLIDENCDSSTPTDTDFVLVVDYFVIDGVVSYKVEEHRFEMLKYRDYNRINCKIHEFQKCIKSYFEANNKFEKEELIDLSNSTATEKIIYLQRLGIIEFLKKKQPFNTSTNSLATIFSALTGEQTTTIQPMLNTILSSSTISNKNNPLKSEKTVSKVEQQLIRIGFNLNKSI